MLLHEISPGYTHRLQVSSRVLLPPSPPAPFPKCPSHLGPIYLSLPAQPSPSVNSKTTLKLASCLWLALEYEHSEGTHQSFIPIVHGRQACRSAPDRYRRNPAFSRLGNGEKTKLQVTGTEHEAHRRLFPGCKAGSQHGWSCVLLMDVKQVSRIKQEEQLRLENSKQASRWGQAHRTDVLPSAVGHALETPARGCTSLSEVRG